MSLDFSTYGMDFGERQDSFRNGNIVPLGTKCFKAGDFLEDTTEVTVTEENQRLISMLWNSGYFLSKDDALKEEERNRNTYYVSLLSSLYCREE